MIHCKISFVQTSTFTLETQAQGILNSDVNKLLEVTEALEAAAQ